MNHSLTPHWFIVSREKHSLEILMCSSIQWNVFEAVICIDDFMMFQSKVDANNNDEWGLILGLRPANERQCYFVTMSLIAQPMRDGVTL